MPTYQTGTDWDNQSSLEIHQRLKLTVPVPVQPKLFAQNVAGANSGITAPSIHCVMFVQEISTIHAGLEDGSIALWALRTTYAGIDCSFLKGHRGPVTCLLALRKGDGDDERFTGLVISGSADASIKLWDPRVRDRSKACVQTLVGHGGTVTALARTGSYVISASTDATVRAWRAVEGRKAALYPWFELQRTLAKYEGWVHSIAFGSTFKVGDRGLIYTGDSTGSVSAFRPRSMDYNMQGQGRLEFEVEGLEKGRRADGSAPPALFRKLDGPGISRILFVADEHLVFTLAFDFKMRTYDVRSGAVILALENSNGCAFTDLTWDARYRQIILTDRYGYVFVFDVKADQIVLCKQVVDEPILGMDFREKTDEVLLCLPSSVQFWQIQREKEYDMLTGGHHGPVISIAAATGMNRDEDGVPDYRVFSASLDNTVRVWDPYDMSCVRVLQEDRSEISAMVYCEGNRTLVTGHDDGTIRLWNMDTGSTVNLRDHTNTVSCIAVAVLKRAEEFVITGGFDGRVGIWDVRKRISERPSLVFMFPAHDDEILAILHDPNKQVLLTAGNDCTIRIWSASTYDQVGELEGHTEGVTCLARDAFFVFSGAEDHTIRVWNLGLLGSGKGSLTSAGAHVKTLSAHTQPVTAVSVLPDTGHLLSCSLDATLLIWDYSESVVVKKFAHQEEMRCLSFRIDTNDVLVGTENHNILVFKLPDELKQRKPGSQIGSDTGTPPPPPRGNRDSAVRFMDLENAMGL